MKPRNSRIADRHKLLEALEPRVLLSGATVSGVVFDDTNANGIQDVNEIAIPDRSIYLFDAVGQISHVAISNSNGEFQFFDVPAGTYQLGETEPAGRKLTAPATPGITLSPGDSITMNIGSHSYAPPPEIIDGAFGYSGAVVIPGDEAQAVLKQADAKFSCWAIKAYID